MHNDILIFSAGRAIIKEREDRKNNKPIKGGKEDNMKKRIAKVESPAENAVLCFYGFCKRKAVTMGGKREITRLSIAKHLLRLFYEAGGDMVALNFILKRSSDYSDADIADLLAESVNGVFEYPTDVENGAKKAYKNMNYFLDCNRQQVYLSEEEFQKAKNVEMRKRIANADLTALIEKIEKLLDPADYEIFVSISNGESIRSISRETGIPNTTLQRRINDLRLKLNKVLDPADYKKIF